MTLIQSWMDSLTLLKPKNLQLFAMVTLKSIIEAYKLYFKYFWWLIGLAIAWHWYDYVYLRDVSAPSWWIFDVQQWVYWFLLLAACFCTRPSIMKKDCAYFRAQYQKNIFYSLLILLLPAGFTIHSFFFQYGSPWKWVGWPLHICLPTTYIILYVFYILFLADSQRGFMECILADAERNFYGSLLSIWNALKMIFYSLPLLVVMYFICIGAPTFIFNRLTRYLLHYDATVGFLMSIILKRIAWPLVLPIPVCIFANIYIKKLHDQFELYKN